MSIFREIPPTAGIPFHAKEIFSAFTGKLPAGSLEDGLKECLRLDHGRITNSGTTALYLILETLKEASPKRMVIIPSYICPLVPLAIARAGLKVKVCDITGKDFNFDPDELKRICAGSNDILAVVAAHMGGIPVDLDAVRKTAGRYGIFVIEDCAQSLGARYKDRFVGQFGDLSFFSLARGKGLTIYEGGLLAANRKEFVKSIDAAITRMVKNKPFSEALKILELFGYWAFYRPALFWFVFRLPQKFWMILRDRIKANQDYYTADFPVHNVSTFRQRVGRLSLHRLEGAIKSQREKARYFMEALKDTEGISFVKESVGDTATYPFVTAIFDKKERRDTALAALKDRGLGASILYLYPVTKLRYLSGIVPAEDSKGGDILASRLITLSTSCYLDTKDLAAIADTLKEKIEC